MRVPHNSFVVVADGEKMLFFRNDGDSDYLKLEVERKRQSENPANRDIKTESPGRAFASVGNGRSAMEEADFHQIEADRFAAETDDLLRERALRNDFDALIVSVPPRTLGRSEEHTSELQSQ